MYYTIVATHLYYLLPFFSTFKSTVSIERLYGVSQHHALVMAFIDTLCICVENNGREREPAPTLPDVDQPS